MKKILLNTISFFASFFNPERLNLIYKALAKSDLFKKIVYSIVQFTIPDKIKLESYDLFLNQKDAMVSGAIALNVYENFEAEVFIKSLRPEMVVVDVGANIGFYTLLAASRVKSVLAFEPDPVNFELLKKNVETNHCQNVSCYKLAISDKQGDVEFYENPNNFGDRRIYSFSEANKSYKVSAISLDEFAEKKNIKIDLIKIDIQGAEGRALAGMKRILQQPSLELFVEFFPAGLRDSGYDPLDILNTLSRHNLKIYCMKGTRHTTEPVENFESFVEKFKNTDYVNLYCKK